MTPTQRTDLIRPGLVDTNPALGAIWADLGAGSGAFTVALLELLGEGGQIYAVDKNLRLPKHPRIHTVWGDFTRPLKLPILDGILMANSLHYVRDKEGLLRTLLTYLKSSGRLLVVEYENRQPSPWLPFPVAFSELEGVASRSGLKAAWLGQIPSEFGGEIYAALLTRP